MSLPHESGGSGVMGAEEAGYHLSKFAELRGVTLVLLAALPILQAALWLGDRVTHGPAAAGTLALRLGMAACAAPCLVALRRGGSRLPFTILLYAGAVTSEWLWLHVVERLHGGSASIIGGSVLHVLAVLVLGLPLRLRDSALGLGGVVLLPSVLAAAGRLRDFPTTAYHALILPTAGAAVLTLWVFDHLYRRIFRYQRAMERLAGEDALTGLPNRRQFLKAGEQILQRVRRYGRPASLLVIDLDHFKTVNDRYGHAAGDAVLRALAQLLREHQRAPDLPARLGGEELAMLLPETDLSGAAAVAERLRIACESLRVEVPGGLWTGLAVTMSVGAATFAAEDASLDDVLRRADAALYRAKHLGRNRVEQ